VQDLRVEILDLEVRHKIASETFSEWFTDTGATTGETPAIEG
jgi:hypothetical protein